MPPAGSQAEPRPVAPRTAAEIAPAPASDHTPLADPAWRNHLSLLRLRQSYVEIGAPDLDLIAWYLTSCGAQHVHIVGPNPSLALVTRRDLSKRGLRGRCTIHGPRQARTTADRGISALPISSILAELSQVSVVRIAADQELAATLRAGRRLWEACHPLIFVTASASGDPKALEASAASIGYQPTGKSFAGGAIVELAPVGTQHKSSFDGAAYWEARYQRGGTSGVGSYNRLASFKASVINRFVATYGVTSILELGSGDGSQAALLSCPRYRGLDISPTAVRRCQETFAGDERRSFAVYDPHTFSSDQEAADLALSLDVLYHLSADDDYERYLIHLFSAARRFVLIFSNDTEHYPSGVDSRAEYVRFRRFTADLNRFAPEWRLADVLPNRYPFNPSLPNTTSFADFYLYCREGVDASLHQSAGLDSSAQEKILAHVQISAEQVEHVHASLREALHQTRTALTQAQTVLSKGVTGAHDDLAAKFTQMSGALASLSRIEHLAGQLQAYPGLADSAKQTQRMVQELTTDWTTVAGRTIRNEQVIAEVAHDITELIRTDIEARRLATEQRAALAKRLAEFEQAHERGLKILHRLDGFLSQAPADRIRYLEGAIKLVYRKQHADRAALDKLSGSPFGTRLMDLKKQAGERLPTLRKVWRVIKEGGLYAAREPAKALKGARNLARDVVSDPRHGMEAMRERYQRARTGNDRFRKGQTLAAQSSAVGQTGPSGSADKAARPAVKPAGKAASVDQADHSSSIAALMDSVMEYCQTNPDLPLVVINSTARSFQETKHISYRSTFMAQALRDMRVPTVFSYYNWDSDPAVSEGQEPPLLEVPADRLLDLAPIFTLRQLPNPKLFVCAIPDIRSAQVLEVLRLAGFTIAYDVWDEHELFARMGLAQWFQPAIEQYVALACDQVFCVCPALAEKMRSFGVHADRIHLLSNGVAQSAVVDDLQRAWSARRRSTTIGYIGNISSHWFDWQAVIAMAHKFPELRIELVGPLTDDGYPRDMPANIQLIGPLSNESASARLANWRVGLAPHLSTDHIRHADSVKIYEYLGAGLPVVSVWKDFLVSYPLVYTYQRPEQAPDALATALSIRYSSRLARAWESFIAQRTWHALVRRLLHSAGVSS